MSDKTKLLVWVVAGTLLVAVSLYTTGCVTKPRAKAGTASADGPADPGTPASASSGSSVATLPVPAGSTVETVPGKPAEAGKPAESPQVKVTLAAPSELRVESHGEASSTGTVDTSVAKARIGVESRKPLLWTAIVCGVLGVLALSVLKEWPIVGRSLLTASALAGVAWKVAEVPWWAFAVVLIAAGLAVAFYKRAEWDANGNGVPDFLEPKKR